MLEAGARSSKVRCGTGLELTQLKKCLIPCYSSVWRVRYDCHDERPAETGYPHWSEAVHDYGMHDELTQLKSITSEFRVHSDAMRQTSSAVW
jgi:hypothetical protein